MVKWGENMTIKQKIYEDYMKKSRLPNYKDVLMAAKANGYEMIGIRDFYMRVINGNVGQNTKYLINRHDIDTSPKIARKLFEIELEVYGHEGTSTYYFRNSTIDKILIKDIEKEGYETGYHYEEIATFEKRMKLKDKKAIKERIPEIREIWLQNLMKFRESTGSMSQTVSSHGDWINDKYSISNLELVQNCNMLEQASVLIDAYDERFNTLVEKRFADQILLAGFADKVISSINQKIKIIQILTHPRNWKTDYYANSKENLKRLFQGIKYNL